jgi:hypothetical protein
LIGDRRDTQGRRCELRAIASSGNLRYLACGEAGVWTVRIIPGRIAELVEQRPTPGVASAFFLRDGTLWVETTSVQAERLAPVAADAAIQPVPSASEGHAGTATQPPAAPAAVAPPVPQPPPAAVAPPLPAAPEPPKPDVAPPAPLTPRSKLASTDFVPANARVIAIEPGFAIIDMGREHGVSAGDHVSFDHTTTERVDEENAAQRTERVAVGNATTIGATRTRVELGIDERVEVGATANPTRDPITSTSFAPARLGGVWHAGFIARPFLVVDNFGVGGSLEVRAGYRFESPFHVEAIVLPATVGTGRQDAIGAFAALVAASFDSKLFEAGLGLGAQTINNPAFDLKPGTGTTLAQRLRIGSVDGGMLEVFTYIVLFHSEFEFSSLEAHGQLPVGDRSWLVVHAGGGTVGMGFGEIGLRVLLNGNGDRGSFFLTATIGGLHLFRNVFCTGQEFNCGSTDYSGPHAGIGGDWRF